jgi:hypothetical protein
MVQAHRTQRGCVLHGREGRPVHGKLLTAALRGAAGCDALCTTSVGNTTIDAQQINTTSVRLLLLLLLFVARSLCWTHCGRGVTSCKPLPQCWVSDVLNPDEQGGDALACCHLDRWRSTLWGTHSA